MEKKAHEDKGHEEPPPQASLLSLLAGIVFLLAIGAAGAVGIHYVLLNQAAADARLKTDTATMAQTTVLVTLPTLGSKEVSLILPGSVQPLRETPVYARVNGYIKTWKYDIGARVKAGDLLAEIDTPETDQQLIQAQASLAQAKANLALSQVNSTRYNELLTKKAVAQQEADTADSDLEVKKANVAAAEAEVGRLQQFESFKQVLAPFDGIITRRNVEVGNLINSGSGANAQDLFRLADVTTLRVFVNVPERFSALMQPGVMAEVEFAAEPNHKYPGKLTRTTEAIDPGTLTLTTEIDVENREKTLLPGGYARVTFNLVTPQPPLLIPGNTLIFRAQGAQVGIVDPATSTVQLKDIKIGRDFGTNLEILDGISATDLVIVNPSDSLTTGMKVETKTLPPPPAPVAK
jgi:RND family efflux transporter MFP subunit